MVLEITQPSNRVQSSSPKHLAPTTSPYYDLLYFIVYLCIGTAVCFGWNAVLNSIASVRSIYFPTTHKFSEMITATYHVSVLVGAVILLMIGAKRKFILFGGLIGNAVSSFLFVYLCPTLMNYRLAPIFLSMAASLLGLFVAFSLTSAFAFASTSASHSAAVSTGMGLGGLLSFGSWVVLTRLIFRLKPQHLPSFAPLKSSLLSITGIHAAITLFSVVGALALSRRVVAALKRNRRRSADMDKSLRTAATAASSSTEDPRSENDDDRSDEDNPNFIQTNGSMSPSTGHTVEIDSPAAPSPRYTYEGHETATSIAMVSWRDLIQSCGWTFLSLFATLLVSLYLFPNIWPLAWNEESSVSELLIGVFQCGDVLGRFIPVWFPPLSSRSITIIAFVRVCLIFPLFIASSPFLMARVQWMTIAFKNPGMETLLIFCLSLSNGIIATLCSVSVTEAVKSPLAKSKASTLALIAFLAGVAAGTSLSTFNPLAARD